MTEMCVLCNLFFLSTQERTRGRKRVASTDEDEYEEMETEEIDPTYKPPLKASKGPRSMNLKASNFRKPSTASQASSTGTNHEV